METLQRKTVVITGASRGIGAAIAEACIQRGMNVGLCARQTPTLVNDRALCVKADVSDEDAVRTLAIKTVERFGRIDCWINNAGILQPIAKLAACSSKDMQTHMNINILGVFHGTKALLQHLHQRGGKAVLINMSSGAATSAYEGWGAYCAGKAAVDSLTEVVQLEEAINGLRAHSIAPGIIDTDMQALIRQCTPEQFPMVQKFQELKQDNAFSSAEFVAERLLDIAFDPAKRPSEVCLRLPVGQ